MERELNKLFNDTNYNKENVIIREIWSIKLELQNFFWGVYYDHATSTVMMVIIVQGWDRKYLKKEEDNLVMERIYRAGGGCGRDFWDFWYLKQLF